MRHQMAFMRLFLILFAIQCLTGYAQQSALPTVVNGQLLVDLKAGSDPERVLGDLNLPVPDRLELLSPPFNLWLVEFDLESDQMELIRQTLLKHPAVEGVQFNHYISERSSTPNDAAFPTQWHHVDPQDNDIDSDLAWDHTTGGYTAHGDTIVVCVIEMKGSDWDHPDLIANRWTNYAEIPFNGIDDDLNGYIDDYRGWNVVTNTDSICGDEFSTTHGTRVSGLIGAKGNNSINVAGINWDIQMMQVQMGTCTSEFLTEANAIKAYTYPLIHRKRYNQTSGAEGAFVVVTNSSWGIDNADPADSPLWCAFYDSLGAAGILSCAATTNANSNVDVVGDMPTTCNSNYLISVTRTDNSDLQSGGYGATHIDLGAPGVNVVTTNHSGGQISASGTSYASPLTAGVVALLYSLPCDTLAYLAIHEPGQTALAMRNALLSGTDPVASLNGKSVTGGRLNAYNSLLAIQTYCDSRSGLISYDRDLSFTLYPNPAQHSLTVDLQNLKDVKILIFNVLGEIVLERPIGSGSSISVEDLNSGSYFVQIESECRRSAVQKLVIN